MLNSMHIFESPEALQAALGPSAVTIGKYDGMHLGHQSILDALQEKAASRGLPTVVILSEPQPEEFFAPAAAPPRLNHFQDKVDFLAQRGIDAVLKLRFDEARSRQSAESFVRDFLVAALGARLLVIGDDFRFGRGRAGDFALLRNLAPQLGFEVSSVGKYCNGELRVSSTLVRDFLQAGDCAGAARLLGRPYSISGPVIRGRQLGRQLGAPTANVALLSGSLPMTGVFAVIADTGAQRFRAVANLGYRPTVSEEPEPSLEVHLLDTEADLYDRILRVHFMEKLRDEVKFASLEALKQQIALDIVEARRVLERQDPEQAFGSAVVRI